MKFRLMAILLMASYLIINPSSYSAEIAPEGTAARKLQRGFLNVALSPIAFTHEIQQESKRKTIEPSWLFGAFRGAVVAVGRSLVGVMEMVTAPFEVLPGRKPLLKPEFSWSYLESSENPS